MAPINVNSTQLAELIASKKTILVDFWAPWCPHCRKINPIYEQIAEEYADVFEIVKLDMDEDDRLWDDLNVELIPTLRIYANGEVVDSVVNPHSKAAIEEFLAQVIPEREQKADDHIYDMIVVGGGPGGYTAALYAARAGLDTLVVEKLSAGGQMSLTNQIDNYPGFEDGISGDELAARMQRQAERFGARTMNAEVRNIDLHASPKLLTTSHGMLWARTVVLATGANPRELGVAGEKELIGKGVAYCAACDGMVYKGKTVAVVGGGNSAVSDALILSRIAKKVIIIHRRDTLRATKVYHDPLMKAENVEFRWNSVVTEFIHGDKLTGVRLKNVQSGEESELMCDGLFVSVGRKPATELVSGQLELDPSGYIIADETTCTTIPGVYAVGDVRTKLMRQIVTAVSDGATAVHMAEEYLAGLGV